MENKDIECRILEEEIHSFWPQWHVVRRIGGGSFGSVFQIYKDDFGLRVDSALKVVRFSDPQFDTTGTTLLGDLQEPGFSREEMNGDDATQRTLPEGLSNEIQIMELLRGAPNVVTIEDFYYTRHGGFSTLYVRMELLTNFQNLLQQMEGSNGLPLSEIVKVGKDICTALYYCEQKNILHRDIKPGNLFRDSFGNYKVGDFGSSRYMETMHLNNPMTSIGTISYMAPEIFAGKLYGNTVDIYSLGLVLYQLLNNGRIPFLPTGATQITRTGIDSANFRRIQGESLPSLAGTVTGNGEVIDERLDAIIRKACHPDPEKRYPTAWAFHQALTEYSLKRPSSVPSDGKNREKKQVRKQPRQPVVRMNRYVAGMIAIAGVLFLAGLGILLWYKGNESHPAGSKTETDADAGTALAEGDGTAAAAPDSSDGSPAEDTNGGSGSASETNPDADADSSDGKEKNSGGNNNSGAGETNAAAIPDPVLRKAILDTMGLETLDLALEKADTLTNLTFCDSSETGEKITDLTGLSGFTNLRELTLAHQQIEDLSPLAGLKQLTKLTLDDNRISDLSPLKELANLEHLNLYRNLITDISPLNGLGKLVRLNLYENRIEDILPLQNLEALSLLYLGGNQIRDLTPLEKLAGLKNLDLGGNQIADAAPLSGLTSLENLTLYDNQITDISPLKGMTRLERLDLYGNQIQDILPVAYLRQLTALYLGNNKISNLSPLAGLTKLQRLEISGNPAGRNTVPDSLSKVDLVSGTNAVPDDLREGDVWYLDYAMPLYESADEASDSVLQLRRGWSVTIESTGKNEGWYNVSFAMDGSAVYGYIPVSEGSEDGSVVDSAGFPEPEGGLEAGDTLFLGSYEQDNNTKNGKEEVEWIVLDRKDDKALLISRYGLDTRLFDQESADWRSCSLRSWMNGEFYDTLFDETEETYVEKADESSGTAAGDSLFLLSAEEVMLYFPLNDDRKAEVTAYCLARGAKTGADKCCWWWLRSPGAGGDHVTHIYFNGSVDSDASPYYEGGTVRPVFWLRLRSDQP